MKALQVINPRTGQADHEIPDHYYMVPYALVGIISPWNVRLTLALIDAIPALLAGSAVTVRFTGTRKCSV